MLYQVILAISGIRTLVVIGTDCTGSCKSNYHTITTTTATIQEARMLKHDFGNDNYLVLLNEESYYFYFSIFSETYFYLYAPSKMMLCL